MKASELFLKMETASGGGAADINKMMPPDDMVVSSLLLIRMGRQRAALWPLLWMEVVLPQYAWWSPLIRQMVPYLKSHCPALWDGARKHLAEWRPEDLAGLEGGPVLSAEQICDLTLKHLSPVVIVIDSMGDIDARKVAFEDLQKVGLLGDAA